MATNWKLLDVDEPESDNEVYTESAVTSPVTSPASKRARKRAIAAQNKKAKKSNGVLPTFVEEAPSIESRLGAPFLAQKQAEPVVAQSEKLPTLVDTQQSNHDDTASVISTEDEDVSLLVDEESCSSEDEVQEAGPSTPRAAQRNFTDTATAATKSTALGAAQAVDLPDQGMLKQDEGQAAAAGASQAPLAYGSDHDPSKKWKAIITRTVWTLIMIAGFCALVLMGHVYLIILVLVCQAVVFKEISALFDVAAKPLHHHHREHSRSSEKAISPTRALRDARAKAERERWSKVLSWYFFATTNYFLHGETIIYYFKHIVFVDAYFIPFARHHRFISFMLYVLGFVGFVTNLKRNQLRRQFGLFCWIHMSLLLIVLSSHFIVNNILEGIIWFWVPASLVVMNDIAAYVWGMMFGRTQLIKLSPKKTVEGFVGAFFSTVVFGYIWSTVFMRYSYMICPATDLGTTAFSDFVCKPNDVFAWRSCDIPEEISTVLSVVLRQSITQIPWAPFQFHAIFMAVFASLVAPFGGFFASGFKRAFNVKDFGDSIPGHGGMTDRMDCQFLMGLFVYVYYSSMIRDNHVTVGAVMQTIVSSLTTDEQIELARTLNGYLTQQGLRWK